MGRKRRDCPVFGCGSTNLARLANHLEQVHDMGTEERAKWLKWSKIGICVPRQGEEVTVMDKELNIERTLERLIKRQDEMGTNLNNLLSTKHGRTTKAHKRKKLLKTYVKRKKQIARENNV